MGFGREGRRRAGKGKGGQGRSYRGQGEGAVSRLRGLAEEREGLT